MTRFIIDESGAWSGGGRAFLANARLAAARHPDTLSVGNAGDTTALEVIPRNLPSSYGPRLRPYILIPQNAWAWHGPAGRFRTFTRRAVLRVGSEWHMRRAKGVIRIGPMIPATGHCHPAFLPNVLDPSFEDALSFSRKIKPSESSEYIVAIGSLNPYRNMETLLRAHERYTAGGGTRRLHIIGGEGDASYRHHLGTPPNVIFHGALSRPETLAWMRDSSLTLLPSLVEASPLTALEALAVGAPLALSDIPGHRYMVKPEHNASMFSAHHSSEVARLMKTGARRSTPELNDVQSRHEQRLQWCDALVQQLADLTLR